jgi:hypothetical protein
MPGAVHHPTRLTPDALEMPKADDDFHLWFSDGSWSRRPRLTGADLWIPSSISCVKLKARLIDESSIPVGRSLIPFLAHPYFYLGVNPICCLEKV